jgi:hypothetical protein
MYFGALLIIFGLLIFLWGAHYFGLLTTGSITTASTPPAGGGTSSPTA